MPAFEYEAQRPKIIGAYCKKGKASQPPCKIQNMETHKLTSHKHRNPQTNFAAPSFHAPASGARAAVSTAVSPKKNPNTCFVNTITKPKTARWFSQQSKLAQEGTCDHLVVICSDKTPSPWPFGQRELRLPSHFPSRTLAPLH